MSLDKDILGTARFNALNAFNNRTLDDLMNQYGTLDNLRVAMMKADSDAIVTHFKTSATIPATGLIAPNGAVTGSAKIQ